MFSFIQSAGIKSKVSVSAQSGKYKKETFLEFMNALTFAKYINNDSTANQQKVDSALIRLDSAYNYLVDSVYAYNVNLVPDSIDYYNKKIATGGTITITSTGISSTKNNSFFVVPIQTTEAGEYIITVHASSARPSNVSPKINLILLDDGSDYASYSPVDSNSISISGSSWLDFKTLKWTANLNNNQLKLLRVGFLVNDASWVANISDIEFRIATQYDLLQFDIVDATKLLNEYSTVGTANYSKVSDQSRTKFLLAINTAEVVDSSASEGELVNGRSALTQAVETFKASISPISVVPGKFDLSLYDSTIGGIVIDTTGINSTRNNAVVLYKFHVSQTGYYIPSVSASTNTETSSKPKINIEIAADSSYLMNMPIDTSKSVNIIKQQNGWNGFLDYSFNKVSLKSDSNYYLKMTFLTNGPWCANLNGLSLAIDTSFTLPMSFIYFGLQPTSLRNSIVLNWKVNESLNTARYVCERSIDGNHFYQIGMRSTGGIPGVKSYSLVDQHPITHGAYYRVSEVDKDGKVEFSKIIHIKANSNRALQVYPNPVVNLLSVRFPQLLMNSTLSIYNNQGERVMLLQVLEDVKRVKNLDVTKLKSGIYHLEIKNQLQEYKISFIKK